VLTYLRRRTVLPMLALLLPWASARGDNDPTVLKGLEFLRSQARGSGLGETALIALALIKAEVPKGDPALAACVARLSTRFGSGGYQPERSAGADIYEAGVVALAFANLDGEGRRTELTALAQFLAGRQNANGSWDYQGRSQGDTSISQYAVLGLWEAENGGAPVSPQVWDRAAAWYISVQSGAGSWNYHRDESNAQNPETVAMTAAGVGSLLICQRQLARYRVKNDSTSSLLVAAGGEGDRRYDAATKGPAIDAAVKRGLNWLGSNLTTMNGATIGQSPFYALYGIERIGALADREVIGRTNWFDLGSQYIRTKQQSNGAWDATHGAVPNTAWAVLFITKSTAKSLKRVEIKRLGSGTLLGGRGLPKDLNNLTLAGGRVISRPMNGQVEGMLAALEDPRGENADAALNGLVTRYRTEGPEVLRPYKDRFRKLLKDRDPGLRRVAAWALARTGDLDAVPPLIDALADPEEPVVTVAREGLQLISRQIVGHGPPSPSTPAQRAEAAGRWRAWYNSARPLDLDAGGDFAAPAAAAQAPAPAAVGSPTPPAGDRRP